MSVLSHQAFANTTTPYWASATTPATLVSPLSVVDTYGVPTKKTTIETTSAGVGSVFVSNMDGSQFVGIDLQQGATQPLNTISFDVGNVNPAMVVGASNVTSSLPIVIDSPINAQNFSITQTPGSVVFQQGNPLSGGSQFSMENSPSGSVTIMVANTFTENGLDVVDKVGNATLYSASSSIYTSGSGSNTAAVGVSGTAAYMGTGVLVPTTATPGVVVNDTNGCELQFADATSNIYRMETTAGLLNIGSSVSPAAISIAPTGQVTIPDIISGSFVPIGGIVMWSGGVLPVNWRLCDGTFGTPDLRDRFIIGAGSFALGTIGGSSLISISNLPPHNHTITDPGHFHSTTAMSEGNQGTNGAAFGRLGNNQGNNSSIATTGITLNLTGSGTNYYQPYYALAFIIRVA